MKPESRKANLRCAIYTRVSSDSAERVNDNETPGLII